MNLKPLGQENAWLKLLSVREKLPQGLLFIGPPGVGKKRAAKALFQLIHCENVQNNNSCGSCKPCIKICQGTHTDLVEILPQGEQILIEDLREMKKMLFFPPMEGKLRLVIIDHAHKMNQTSANSLLKTLEEPPAHTRFILITHERGIMLPTILSRCQYIAFSPLSKETLALLFERQGITTPSQWLDFLDGGLERAQVFSDEKLSVFLNSLEKNKPSIEELSSEDGKLELFLDFKIYSEQKKSKEISKNKNLSQAYVHAQSALEAAYLRRRLSQHANRKLIAAASLSI